MSGTDAGKTEAKSLAGELLLAMPGIGDPRFAHAVIAMCVHTPGGALGIGIGSLVPKLTLHGLLDQLEIDPGVAPDRVIHLGGPVERQRGFVLHSDDWAGEDTLTVPRGLALTTTLDVLRAIAAGEGPSRWLVALGYAGWGAHQLDGEMARHGWFSTAADAGILFDVPAAERWPRAFAAAGVDVRLLASTTGHA
ncbi:YqgE/AlgH family protein [Sphingomonas bacterium]|uniref:YqgE/AlgH family protein n=1 Tax=Sphingomonas bacterium TaxID=1895847 RepID=UPI001576E3FF|nr:YqgE/AlgH family protein [Sphingomonas bacterium]